jgi:hypothetical protein
MDSLLPLPDMPLLPITSKDTVAACRDLKVSDHDIFVCSYPKSGTTWTQNLVCRLLAAHVGMSLPDDWHLSHSAPFYEVDQYWEHNNKSGGLSDRMPAHTPIRNDQTKTTYRVFNTHLRPHQLPPNAKCVYVVRDPLDVLASFYYHLANMAQADGGYDGTPQEFCKGFLDGTILYGKWQDHLEAWLGQEYSTSQTVLLLHYEDMKENLQREATQLAKHFGVTDERLQAVVDTAVPKCTFSAMKEDRWRYTPRSVSWKIDETTGKPYENFVRAGKIGDGRQFFETYASDELVREWLAVLEDTRVRWNKAKVVTEITTRYIGNDDS